MNKILLWFLFGVFTSLALLMVVFGILFIKDVYVHRAEASFGSLIFGILLLMAGAGVLSSTIAETVRRLFQR